MSKSNAETPQPAYATELVFRVYDDERRQRKARVLVADGEGRWVEADAGADRRAAAQFERALDAARADGVVSPVRRRRRTGCAVSLHTTRQAAGCGSAARRQLGPRLAVGSLCVAVGKRHAAAEDLQAADTGGVHHACLCAAGDLKRPALLVGRPRAPTACRVIVDDDLDGRVRKIGKAAGHLGVSVRAGRGRHGVEGRPPARLRWRFGHRAAGAPPGRSRNRGMLFSIVGFAAFAWLTRPDQGNYEPMGEIDRFERDTKPMQQSRCPACDSFVHVLGSGRPITDDSGQRRVVVGVCNQGHRLEREADAEPPVWRLHGRGQPRASASEQ